MQREARTVAQHEGVKLGAYILGWCEVAGQDRLQTRAYGNSADFGEVPFHHRAGRERHPIENVDRFDQLSQDWCAEMLDGDTTPERQFELRELPAQKLPPQLLTRLLQ
jgi:hypothetical protein